MYVKGAVINGKHLWEDWGLRIEDCDIGPPEVNDVFVPVPGGKTLDLSEANGPVSYKKREINLELGAIKEKNAWRTFLSSFMNEYHGRKVEAIFDDDLAFYYIGRAYIKADVERTARVGKFEMEIIAEPYKYEIQDSQEPWKWGSFNFMTGVIRYLGEVEISQDRKQIIIPKGEMLTVPVFEVSRADRLKVLHGSKAYELRDGKNRYPQIKVGGASEVRLDFQGTGLVKVRYRGGSL